jgi:dihydroneopterin aldolase
MVDSNYMRISLNDVHFFGYHGIYEEEKILGNTFIVNLYVDFSPAQNVIRNISETIDYVTLFELVKARMAKPTPLLETIVTELAESILTNFSLVHTVFVKITKLQVAIKTLEGNMSVAITKTR